MNNQPLTIECQDGVHYYVEQPQMQVEVILASRHADLPGEKPLYTVRLRYPRIIHGEIMTHRVFSRNARSSRAVPVKTMLMECTSIPFVPWHWGKNQKGMQAGEECRESVDMEWIDDMSVYDGEVSPESAWLFARDSAVRTAEGFMEAGYHKQIPNRLLEPFSWIDTLITANDWDNFLWLRDHKDAEPHLQDLARLVKVALASAEVQELKPGEWHFPYIDQRDHDAAYNLLKKNRVIRSEPSSSEILDVLCKVSAARCARISYKPFDGDASYERELERYDMLISSDRVHASPTEHQATPDERVNAHLVEARTGRVIGAGGAWKSPELHGNLPGYIQARKLIPNECYHG